MDNKKKLFRAGGTSALLIALVLAVAVVLNLVVGELPSTWTKLDTSVGSLFTISQQTEDVLGGLTEDITLTLVSQSGMEDATVQELLQRYASISSRIKVETKDPVLYPYYITQYTDDTVYNNTIVVESSKRSKVVGYYDIYQMSYNADYTTNTEFAGEMALTSAISYVTTDRLPKVYLLEGHGEAALGASMEKAIEQNNMELNSLNLLTVEAIPNEVECLIVNGPTADLSENEASMLGSYLRNGGRMLLFTNYSDVEMPNLMGVLEAYGAYQENGIIIEGDSGYCLQGYTHYLLPEIVNHVVTQPLLDGSHFVLAPLVHGITIGEIPEGVSTAPLLTTSDASYLKEAGYEMTTMEKEDGDGEGPFHLGVAISEVRDQGTTRVVWYSTNLLLDESLNDVVSGGNLDLVLNSLSWMVEQEESITIHAKNMNTDYLTVSSFDANMWSLLLVAVIPVGIMVLGGIVWYRRKKR